MGKRGPQPLPTAIRVLEGQRAHRPLPANEPEFPAGIPDRPTRISPAAGRIWDELIGDLASVPGLLSPVDKRALWQVTEDEALIAEAYEGVWKMIRAVKGKAKAENKKLPAGAMMALIGMENGRLAMRAIRDMSARLVIERREFGLTPSSRSRLSIEAAGGVVTPFDPIEQKLCG